ncbi:RNA methyltransferase [Polymorphobacter arshaanensis]|uniref:RNA methyltransferase n=1 Tax=Glacieibacterium arshaanense TaxID=2511025 RepID=A0A4Y9ENK3_9SPHN|nr:RNA methyltransferase [Polymorphobacter arshaanensis]TFU03655.1 RNA methyltransferase [Polymorphobacter arshaanensis]
MPVVVVIDPDDPRLAPYRDIRERDLVGRDREFIAEGKVVVERMLAGSRHKARSLLIAEHRVPALGDMIAAAGDLPVYAAAQPVLDRIAGFALHRGILAHGAAAAPIDADALLASLPDRVLLVVLVGISNHDNIGGIFRNAAAFGAAAVLLAPDCCDPLYRKAVRVSVGATLTVPFATVEGDLLDLLTQHRFEALALSPHRATRLADLVRAPRIALLLGAEGPGLPDALLARARAVAIPIVPGFDSLNVATSSGIALAHFFEPDTY